jgi:hypothetical protein
MTDHPDLPTAARTTLAARYVRVLLTCGTASATPNLQA